MEWSVLRVDSSNNTRLETTLGRFLSLFHPRKIPLRVYKRVYHIKILIKLLCNKRETWLKTTTLLHRLVGRWYQFLAVVRKYERASQARARATVLAKQPNWESLRYPFGTQRNP